LQVNYINAHATSTLAGDLAEMNAIKQVFKDPTGIKVNATKVIHHPAFVTSKDIDSLPFLNMVVVPPFAVHDRALPWCSRRFGSHCRY
jgi:hypothetical protein